MVCAQRRLAMVTWALVAVAALAGAARVHSQSQRIPVFVSQTGDDAVGGALAYSVREELRRSAGYEVSTQGEAVFRIMMVSIDAASSEGTKGLSSAISVTYTMTNYLPYEKTDPQTWYPIYLTSAVHTLGRNRVDNGAKSIVADLDAAIEEYRAASKR